MNAARPRSRSVHRRAGVLLLLSMWFYVAISLLWGYPRAEAAACSPLACNDSFSGMLETGGTDCHTFAASAGDIVTVTLAPDRFYGVLSLRGVGGTLVAKQSTTAYASSVQIADVTLPASGTYAIEVSYAYNHNSGTYRASWRRSAPTACASPALGCGDVANGMVLAGQAMHHAFTGTAGDIVTVTLAADRFYAALRLLGPDGRIVAKQTTTAYSSSVQIADTILPISGTYTIEAGDLYNHNSGNYSVSWRRSAPTACASPQLNCGDVANGSLNRAQLMYHAFAATAGDVVTVTLAADRFYAALRLLGPDGRIVAKQTTTAYSSSVQIVDMPVPLSGMYTIEVSDLHNHDDGTYHVSWRRSAPTACASPALACGDVANNSLDTAQLGYYALAGAAGDVVTVTLAADRFYGALRLLAPDGKQVARQATTAYSSSVQIEDGLLPVSGTYTIEIGDLYNHNSGMYHVSWRRSAPMGCQVLPPPVWDAGHAGLDAGAPISVVDASAADVSVRPDATDSTPTSVGPDTGDATTPQPDPGPSTPSPDGATTAPQPDPGPSTPSPPSPDGATTPQPSDAGPVTPQPDGARDAGDVPTIVPNPDTSTDASDTRPTADPRAADPVDSPSALGNAGRALDAGASNKDASDERDLSGPGCHCRISSGLSQKGAMSWLFVMVAWLLMLRRRACSPQRPRAGTGHIDDARSARSPGRSWPASPK